MMSLRRCALLALLAALPLSVQAKAPVSFSSLLEEMTDPAEAARWPDPSFALKQASACERSKSDKKALPAAPSGERVMLDVAGPGAVVRLWTRGPGESGVIRVYIDGAAKPVLSGPDDAWIGGDRHFTQPLAFTTSRGSNLYAPIPFAKRIRMTYEGPADGFCYDVNFRQYPGDTAVQSFSLADFTAAEAHSARTAQALRTPMAPDYSETGRLAPQESFRSERRTPGGAEALTHLQFRLSAPDLSAALRETVLIMTFDGHRTVEIPVGDFFGTGPDLIPIDDRWRHVDAERLLSAQWVMPYQKECVIELANRGRQAVTYDFVASRERWNWNSRSLYFHAASRRDARDISPDSRLRYTHLAGRGVYRGDTLSVLNPTSLWWGGAGERISLDGEATPSHIGTATDHYYGYGRGSVDTFQTPFVSQPRADAHHQGHTLNSRLRVLDAIPFRQSLTLDMDLWHWRSAVKTGPDAAAQIEYTVATFWYGDE